MSAPIRCDSPSGFGPGAHVCWTYADAAGLAGALVPYLDEGRRRGEQLLLVGSSRDELLAATDALPERDAMIADGRLRIRSVHEAYLPAGALDPAAQIRAFRHEVDDALALGRTGLRVAADLTELVTGAQDRTRRQLHRYELLVAELFDALPLIGMCLYADSVAADVLGPVAVVHPLQHRGSRDALAYLSGRDPRFALHGEIDVSNADAVRVALLDAAGRSAPELVVDLRELGFLDVAGARMLERVSRTLAAAGVRLRLDAPTRTGRRCLELFDVDVAGGRP